MHCDSTATPRVPSKQHCCVLEKLSSFTQYDTGCVSSLADVQVSFMVIANGFALQRLCASPQRRHSVCLYRHAHSHHCDQHVHTWGLVISSHNSLDNYVHEQASVQAYVDALVGPSGLASNGKWTTVPLRV